MLCEERGSFLEIADVVKGLGPTILNGVMESCSGRIWEHFTIEVCRISLKSCVFRFAMCHLKTKYFEKKGGNPQKCVCGLFVYVSDESHRTSPPTGIHPGSHNRRVGSDTIGKRRSLAKRRRERHAALQVVLTPKAKPDSASDLLSGGSPHRCVMCQVSVLDHPLILMPEFGPRVTPGARLTLKLHNESPNGLVRPIRLSFDDEGGLEEKRDEEFEDLRKPYKEVLKFPFSRRIIEFSASNHRTPTNLKIYDGSTDPDDHITRFVGAANQGEWEMPVWCRMFQQTLDGPARGWFDRMPNGCIDNWTDLREAFLEVALESEKLNHLVKDVRQRRNNRGRQTRNNNGRGKAKEWMNVPVSFPPIPTDDVSDGPLIIETEVEGYWVRRIFVDQGAAIQVMFKHCFDNLSLDIKAHLTPTQTELVGFSGEQLIPVGKIELGVRIGGGGLIRHAMMKFTVVRASSPYNIILGCTGLRELRAISSTVHAIMKFLTPKGIATLCARSDSVYECRCSSEAESSGYRKKRCSDKRSGRMGESMNRQTGEVQTLDVKVDSKLVACQMNGAFAASNEGMARYLAKAKEQAAIFKKFSIKNIPRNQNQKADVLNKLASAAFIPSEEGGIGRGIWSTDENKARTLQTKISRMHVGARSVVAKIMRQEYYWPTMHEDTKEVVDRCDSCQIHAPIPKLPKTRLTFIMSPWPFYQWGLDILRPFQKVPANSSSSLWFGLPMVSITDNGRNSLTYGSEVVIPAEIGMPTYRTIHFNEAQNEEEIRINLDLSQERRETAAIRKAKYKKKAEQYYNKRVWPVSIKVGDFVYQKNAASRVENQGKLGPNWEGPYRVTETYDNGSYKLATIDDREVPRTWHTINLRNCFM
nr:reverse transcriptase domain-containing protein [Tanacetum cinerariifolium]